MEPIVIDDWGRQAKSPVRAGSRACIHFQSDRGCNKGESCGFLHAAGTPKTPNMVSRSPGGVCKFFESPSGCSRGSMCKFNHPGAAPSPKPMTPKTSTSTSTSSPTLGGTSRSCFSFARGRCDAGARCRFEHMISSNPGIILNDAASAMRDKLFGWRGFVTSSLAKMTPQTMRLVYFNLSDIQVTLLIRGAEKAKLFHYFGGDKELFLERTPFQTQYSGKNAVLQLLEKSGTSLMAGERSKKNRFQISTLCFH